MKKFDISFTKEQADEVLVKHRAVYLYGLGETLPETVRYLQSCEIPILGILDQNSAFWGTLQSGVEVFPPETLTELDTPIIICARLKYDEIYQSLKERGCSCILPFYFYKEDQVEELERYRIALAACHAEREKKITKIDADEPLIINSIDVMLTERCSLRCRDCANLMQFYTNPQHENFEQQIKALDAIMDAVDFVDELRVLGGEPLVSPDFHRYVKHMLTYDKVGSIVVYSNATIVPRGEALECLKDPRIFLHISDYGPVSRELAKIKTVLNEHKISFEAISYSEWLDCASFTDQKRTKEELEEVFAECCARDVYTLKGGKLYGCPYIANGAALQAIPSTDCQSVSTDHKLEVLRQELRQFQQLSYFDGCKYCTGRPRLKTNTPAAVQISAPRPYQKFN